MSGKASVSTRIRPCAKVVDFQLPSTPEAKVLHQVRAVRQCDRKELQHALGFSQPSITRYLARIGERGLIEEKPASTYEKAGRPRKTLAISGASTVCWGLHIGVRSAELAVVDGAGSLLAHATVPVKVRGASPEEYVQALAYRMAALGEKFAAPEHIGVALSAFVDQDATVTSPAFGWDGVNIGELLARAFDQDVAVATGVAAMAGRQLAHEPLGPGGARSTLYFYARDVLAHAWLFHGAVHRSLSDRAPRFLQSAEVAELRDAVDPAVHPLSVTALIAAVRARGVKVTSLNEVVAAAQHNADLQELMHVRAHAIAEIIGTAIDVVGPHAVVLAGDTFALDRATTMQVKDALSDLYPEVSFAMSGNNALVSAAMYMAVCELWRIPLGE